MREKTLRILSAAKRYSRRGRRSKELTHLAVGSTKKRGIGKLFFLVGNQNMWSMEMFQRYSLKLLPVVCLSIAGLIVARIGFDGVVVGRFVDRVLCFVRDVGTEHEPLTAACGTMMVERESIRDEDPLYLICEQYEPYRLPWEAEGFVYANCNPPRQRIRLLPSGPAYTMMCRAGHRVCHA